MDDLDFTEEEIREQLEKLGYSNVPASRLAEFKRDLERLVCHEKSKNSSWSTCSETTSSESKDVYRHQAPWDQSNRYGPHVNKLEYHNNGNENVVYDHAGQQSIVTKTRVVPPNFSMYSTESEVPDGQDLHASVVDESLNTTCSSDRKLIKRRVLRKRDGHTEVTDELTESEADTASILGDRLRDLDLDPDDAVGRRHPSHFNPYQHRHTVRPQSARSTPCGNFGLPEDYDGPGALIRPMTSHPNSRNVTKSDPVARYQKYRQSWDSQRAPGEKNHKNLRWNVREQMLYHDVVVEKKPHRLYVPNKFVIPSDKKRKSLRWQVRQDLAQGFIPPSMYD